jgi:hypothetical protein
MNALERTRFGTLAALLLAIGCSLPDSDDEFAVSDQNAEEKSFGASWPEANSNFMKDRFWLGGDQAASVKLDDERVLWVFGDTYIDVNGDGKRTAPNPASKTGDLYYLNNTLAIQNGKNPAWASLGFVDITKQVWGKDTHVSYFDRPQDNPNIFYWPAGNPFLVDGKLVVFLTQVSTAGTSAVDGANFRTVGGEARVFTNFAGDPKQWTSERIVLPAPFGIAVGQGATFVHEGYVYNAAVREPLPDSEKFNRRVYLARYPIADLSENLAKKTWPKAEWLYQGRFQPEASITDQPDAIFDRGQTEFSIHYDKARKLFIDIQTDGLWGKANIVLRTAPKPEGPWTPQKFLFNPPENAKADQPCGAVPDGGARPIFNLYAGKAHPELADPASPDALVVTYIVNFDNYNCTENYYPKFVRVDLRDALGR